MKTLYAIVVSLFLGSLAFPTLSQDCDIIYVTPTGSGLEGSPLNPTNVEQAFEIFTNEPERNRMRILEGIHEIDVKLEVPSNLTIEGGFTALGADWQKNSSAVSILNISPPMEVIEGVGHHIAIELLTTDNVILRDLTINAMPNGSASVHNGHGASIYAVYVHSSTNYTIERCVISTGDAADGVMGNDGDDGNPGGPGFIGDNGGDGSDCCGGGGAGGVGFHNGGVGGTGGYGSDDGDQGASGFGPQGGLGGSAGDGDGDHTCAFGCVDAGSGGPGAGGGTFNGMNGMDATGGSIVNGVFVPAAGGNGTDGDGGSGGGGGGGGGGTDCCLDDRGAGGGGGGGGGWPGTGATGGGGGGSTYAVFIWNNGAGGQLVDVVLNPGGAGFGAAGGEGGQGGAGGPGAGGGVGLDNGGDGGDGGPGSPGGNGGDGGTGSAGEIVQLYQNGSFVSEIDTSWPLPDTYSALYSNGCTNSQIALGKTFGTWDLPGMGAAFINDVNVAESSYSTFDNDVIVYFNDVGNVDLLTNQAQINNFMFIENIRSIPAITGVGTSGCTNDPVDIGSSESGEAYNWTIYDSEWTSIFTSNNASLDQFEFSSGGQYYFKLEVLDECCGWSVPVYDSLFVNESVLSNNIIESFICEGDSVLIGSDWQLAQGVYFDSLQTAAGCDSLITHVVFHQDCGLAGCTDPDAINYDSTAVEDDGSCSYIDFETICAPGSIWDEELQTCVVYCQADMNYDGIVNTADLLIFLVQFGVSCDVLFPG